MQYCTPGGPLTVRDSFLQLKKAYRNNNSSLFLKTLSSRTRTRIEQHVVLIQQMPDKARGELAAQYNIKKEKFDQLTIKDYILIQITLQKKQQRDPSFKALQEKIHTIQSAKEEALIFTTSGVALRFVKEGPYWFCDFKNL
jgi:hypothetical protein